MPDELRIQVRIDGQENQNFADRLKTVIDSGQLPQEARLIVTKPKSPAGGFALTVPPEIIIAIATAVVTTTASEIVKTVWSELREFLKSRHDKPRAKPIVIIVNGKEFSCDGQDMPSALPDMILPEEPK